VRPQPRLRPPGPGEAHRDGHVVDGGGGDVIRLTVPPMSHAVSVTIALGAATTAGARSAADRPLAAPSFLAHLAEAKRLDTDYSNRNGFDERFLSGFPVRIDAVVAPRAGQLARLLDSSQGPLRYQHFSIYMHATRRFALLTATNIDAASYLEIDRKTGRVREGAEGETWYKDRRIDAKLTVTQDFYSAWSDYFDRGHLVRRTDPIFGTETTALRAHADTFHFTNCTPQHFRFNQSTVYWQGMERFVLEKGVLDTDANTPRISVLQGPIFRADDWIADYEDDDGPKKVKVPGAFWKLALWKGAGGKRALAMIASQVPLWDESRRNIARPDDEAPIQVDQFRVSVRELSLATGLDFSPFEAADTMGSGGIRVAEGRRLITSWEQMGL
jgi:endonuclease G, mitochondrial